MDLKICADCALWVTNADDSSVDNDATGNEYRTRRDAGLKELGGYLVVTTGDSFTHSGCHVCRQTGHHGLNAVLLDG